MGWLWSSSSRSDANGAGNNAGLDKSSDEQGSFEVYLAHEPEAAENGVEKRKFNVVGKFLFSGLEL